MKLNKEIIDLIEEKTSCSVSDEDDMYYIYVDNACDEDFELTINKSDHEIEDIINSCEGFDSEEHFRMWFGANNGEPSNPRTLLDNCEEIGEHLEELKYLLEGVLYEQ